MEQTLNRRSPLPYYYQLVEMLRSEIDDGRWAPGSALLSERELCERYSVSRTVVRQALAQLVNDGLIYREKGKGSFVSHPKIVEEGVQRLVSFNQSMAEKGLAYTTVVIRHQVVEAESYVAKKLGVAPGETLVRSERVRVVGDEPYVFVVNYIPTKLCPGLEHEDLGRQSLYDLLERRYGLRLSSARRIVEARVAPSQVADALRVREGHPILVVTSLVFAASGQPVEYYVASFRGDRVRLETEVKRIARGESQDCACEQPVL